MDTFITPLLPPSSSKVDLLGTVNSVSESIPVQGLLEFFSKVWRWTKEAKTIWCKRLLFLCRTQEFPRPLLIHLVTGGSEMIFPGRDVAITTLNQMELRDNYLSDPIAWLL